jgi:hypothetical protein
MNFKESFNKILGYGNSENEGTTRRFFKADLQKETPDYKNPPKEMVQEKDANLIGSLVRGKIGDFNSIHMPVLDIDFPAELIPSSTPGHFHLYLNKEVQWDKYYRLLQGLAEAGIIEEGYMRAAHHHGGTFVRKPGIKKGMGIPLVDKTPEEEYLEAVGKYKEILDGSDN